MSKDIKEKGIQMKGIIIYFDMLKKIKILKYLPVYFPPSPNFKALSSLGREISFPVYCVGALC